MLSDEYFSKLFLRYQGDMMRLACLYLKNQKDAEDIVGDCWVAVMVHKKKFETMGEDATRSYLLRCVTNASIDFWRRKKRQDTWLEGVKKEAEKTSGISTEDQVIEKMTMDEIYQMLPWRESEIFNLWMQGWPFPAIARQLGISPATTRTYWWRARQKLQRLVDKE